MGQKLARLQENHGLQNSPLGVVGGGGGVNPYLATGLTGNTICFYCFLL